MKKLIEKINKIAKDYEELEYFYEPLIGEYEEHLDYFKIVEDKPGICLQDEDLFYKMFLTFISCLHSPPLKFSHSSNFIKINHSFSLHN